jgi:hypothetical protein
MSRSSAEKNVGPSPELGAPQSPQSSVKGRQFAISQKITACVGMFSITRYSWISATVFTDVDS